MNQNVFSTSESLVLSQSHDVGPKDILSIELLIEQVLSARRLLLQITRRVHIPRISEFGT